MVAVPVFSGASPDAVPTYEEVMGGSDSGLKAQMQQNLHTGTFSAWPLSSANKGPNSHAEMNKDNPDSTRGGQKPSGSNNTYYDYARAAAQKAATAYIKKNKKEIEAAGQCPCGCRQ